MMRMTIMLLVVTALAFLVTACGKRGGLEHPEDVTPTYPRTYPAK